MLMSIPKWSTIFFFNWGIVATKCCVSFLCSGKWICCIHTRTHSLLGVGLLLPRITPITVSTEHQVELPALYEETCKTGWEILDWNVFLLSSIQSLIQVKRPCWCCLLAKSCRTLFNTMHHTPQAPTSAHEISQARILEGVAISFFGGSSWPRDRTHISCIGRQVLYHWATS